MPKLKTHHWVAATLSLKNCFGCMPGRVYGWPKDVFHVHNVPNSILDIVGAVRPSLAIIDGIVGMEGDGPMLGTPVHSGVVVVSRDPVAADVTGARLMGMEPEKVEYLMEAGRFLGQARSELIEQRGEDPERLAKQFAPRARVRARRRVGAPYCDQRDQIHTIRTARHTPMRTAYTPCTVIATTVSAYAENGGCAPPVASTRRVHDRAEG